MTDLYRNVVATLATVACFSTAVAQSRVPIVPGPPTDIQARPPIHVRPFLSTGPQGYSPSQMAAAYGFNVVYANGKTGLGQTIAIVDAYGSPTVQNDLNIFSDTFGLPRTQVQIVYAGGKSRRTDYGWSLETALDVQWAHAMAPGAKILLVVAKSASLGDLLNAVDAAVKNGAQQVSMSWGASEFSSEGNYDSHFNRPGVTFFASSGDNGAGVEWPAASPYVVSVGGTTLTFDGLGNVSETAWSGSGGGISSYESIPAYQTPVQAIVGSRRGVPDVSYNADPNTGVSVYIGNYYGQAGWVVVGGTSAGSPQWAALNALANQAGVRTLADSTLYPLSSRTDKTFLDDIIGGSNGYNAVAGYDLATGLGSPVADQLVLVP